MPVDSAEQRDGDDLQLTHVANVHSRRRQSIAKLLLYAHHVTSEPNRTVIEGFSPRGTA